jgi:hypothetical protein
MPPGSIAALALAAAAVGGVASAQTAPLPASSPATVYPAPRFLPGFTHPDITQCKTISAARRECLVPAKVGGRYMIEAAGFANSTSADATVAMNIIVGEQVCIMETGNKFTGRGYVHLVCEATLATDTPIKIAVNAAARNATLDANGPTVQIRNLPWDGVVSVRGSDGGPLPNATPSATPSAKPGH